MRGRAFTGQTRYAARACTRTSAEACSRGLGGAFPLAVSRSTSRSYRSIHRLGSRSSSYRGIEQLTRRSCTRLRMVSSSSRPAVVRDVIPHPGLSAYTRLFESRTLDQSTRDRAGISPKRTIAWPRGAVTCVELGCWLLRSRSHGRGPSPRLTSMSRRRRSFDQGSVGSALGGRSESPGTSTAMVAWIVACITIEPDRIPDVMSPASRRGGGCHLVFDGGAPYVGVRQYWLIDGAIRRIRIKPPGVHDAGPGPLQVSQASDSGTRQGFGCRTHPDGRRVFIAYAGFPRHRTDGPWGFIRVRWRLDDDGMRVLGVREFNVSGRNGKPRVPSVGSCAAKHRDRHLAWHGSARYWRPEGPLYRVEYPAWVW